MNDSNTDAATIATIRWGIVGAGRIARLAGVWSRRAEPARALAEEFDARAFGDFDAMLAQVDALYIATMQDSHTECALRAFAAGKPVLCEKPAAVNARAATDDRRGPFGQAALHGGDEAAVLSALPAAARAFAGRSPIGEIGLVRGLLDGERAARSPVVLAGSRRRRAARHQHLRGISRGGLARRGARRADHRPSRRNRCRLFASLNVRHERGIAQLFCGLDLQGRGNALIGGTLGTVTIHEGWWNPARASIAYTDGCKVELDEPFTGGGLNYETAHFCELLRAGKLDEQGCR